MPRLFAVIFYDSGGLVSSYWLNGAKPDRKSLVAFIYESERSIRHIVYMALLNNFCIKTPHLNLSQFKYMILLPKYYRRFACFHTASTEKGILQHPGYVPPPLLHVILLINQYYLFYKILPCHNNRSSCQYT